jgi:hypothetical protein
LAGCKYDSPPLQQLAWSGLLGSVARCLTSSRWFQQQDRRSGEITA